MTDVIAAARAVAPMLAGRSAEIEAARRLPADLARNFAHAGLFRMLVPKSLGGVEAAAADIFRALSIVAEADASAGWCVMIGSTSALTSAYLDEEVAREVFANPSGVYAAYLRHWAALSKTAGTTSSPGAGPGAAARRTQTGSPAARW